MIRRVLSSLTALTLLGMVLVAGFLIHASWPFIQGYWPESLWGREWYPYEQLFGLLPAIIGSLWSVLIALIIAVPTALAVALLCGEILPPHLRQWNRLLMEVLAGVPSVVYGLIGLWVLLPLLENQLDLLTGRSLLAAGLLLSLMILPTLTLLCEDALHGVSQTQRHAAMELGIDWANRVFRILLPQAWPGIRSAILLSMGRAMGETIAVMLVVGSIDRIPDPWYRIIEPAQTLTSRIGREMGEASLGSMHWSALMSCGLILALAAVTINLLAWRQASP